MTGRIVKAIRGFYYVEAGGSVVECKARGIFRKDGITPCVGDMADIRMDRAGGGTIVEIIPRKNELARPPLANLDCMAVVISVADPPPNLYVTDKYIAVLEHKDIEPVIVVTKPDLGTPETFAEIYVKAGYPVYVVCVKTGHGLEAFKDMLSGKLCAFCGNSGVGKSSLLNAIDPHFGLKTGETSKKLGRGRHTTRHVELFAIDNGALVADTPGFSTVDFLQISEIGKESLPWCFRDMEPYLGGCRFADCSHTREAGCAVLSALEQGKIGKSRHESYLSMLNEIGKSRFEYMHSPGKLL